jgi:hypothetical protein
MVERGSSTAVARMVAISVVSPLAHIIGYRPDLPP